MGLGHSDSISSVAYVTNNFAHFIAIERKILQCLRHRLFTRVSSEKHTLNYFFVKNLPWPTDNIAQKYLFIAISFYRNIELKNVPRDVGQSGASLLPFCQRNAPADF